MIAYEELVVGEQRSLAAVIDSLSWRRRSLVPSQVAGRGRVGRFRSGAVSAGCGFGGSDSSHRLQFGETWRRVHPDAGGQGLQVGQGPSSIEGHVTA